MIASSLRFRLVLAFSVLVGLVLFVGIVSYSINEQVRQDVSDLQPPLGVDISSVDLRHSGVEFKGYWNPAGAFVATEMSEEPGRRQPSLRGRISAVDPEKRTFTMYGIEIRVTASTDGDADKSGKDSPFDFAGLAVGRRAEVSCKIDEQTGQWSADQIELRDVKTSDKVKGLVTPVDLDGIAPEIVRIHGLQIVLQPVRESGPRTALSRIRHGTQMLRALQNFRASAHVAVGANGLDAASLRERQEAAQEMDRQAAQFERLLADIGAEATEPAAVPRSDSLARLRDLVQRVPRLQGLVAAMHRHLDGGDREIALDFLSDEIEPFLDQEMVSYVYAYLGSAEEDLADELDAVLERTGTTTRVALWTSVFAVLVAGALGLMVWRSIHVPIRRLHSAAIHLGQGRLETRVEAGGHDELGVLARAFNGMAEQLAASTVSVTSLQAIFDSMAAAVVLCDQSGVVTQANGAAERMLARPRGELVGQPFRSACRMSTDETVGGLATASSKDGGSLERSLLRADGRTVPVSLSCAELRTSDGGLQGYVLVAQDLSHLKAIEGRLRESLGEKELLLREVHHRVKNNMQVISSLLAMQSTSGDPEVQRRLEESQNRIRTIALIHEQLYQSTELAHIDTKSYLQVLAQHLVLSFGKQEQVRLDLDLDELHLDLDQSLACGLIVNELLTNAFKYAFEDGQPGVVALRMKVLADGQRLLEVADNGKGLVAKAPSSRRTLGTSLVAKLARQLRGKVAIVSENGYTVRIVFEGRTAAEAVEA